MVKLSAFSFPFLGGGLRVNYNSEILEKSRPPLGFKNSQIEIGNFFFFFDPPPLSGNFYHIFRILSMTPPLRSLCCNQNWSSTTYAVGLGVWRIEK